ncbi:MAG: hypothetical protein JWO05_387 [Gemmatimonadetes bacterium]|nr:hypothetical protein [Gemmatimonadota bacterium]
MLAQRIAGRLVQGAIVLLVVATLAFFLVHLAPGDAMGFESARMPPAVRDQLRHSYGLDRPVGEQYLRYIGNVARGNFGWSVSLQRPVSEALALAVPRTLLLAGLSLLLSMGGAILVALAQVRSAGSLRDRSLGGALMLLYSVPDFWLALVVLLAFAYWIPIFPAGGIVDPVMHDYLGTGGRIADRARHLVLPLLTLTFATMAGYARYQRAALLDVLPLDFIRTARAKGVPERAVVSRHALRNALLPTITLLGISLPALLGGAVFVEAVFAWPGMGLLTANAIGARDAALVTASVVVGGALVVVGSLLADLLYAVVDPRLRAR